MQARSASVRVGIVGATGFAGQELVRLVARHPGVTLTTTMASGEADRPRPLPGLSRIWDGNVVPYDAAALAGTADVAFLALPDDRSAQAGPELVDRGLRVFDLSGAFRLRDEAQRRHWYPHTPAVPSGTVYGLPELHHDALRGASLVACPGCYPTAALIALAPLVAADLVTGEIVIDAKSGVSGAGKAPSERTHFSECHGSVSAYGLFGHRHVAEIEQELGAPVTFVPHLVPLDRGILETIYTRVRPGVTEEQVGDVLASAYADRPLVRLTGSRLPAIKQVAYTNFCDIGWRLEPDGTRLVLVACLDNLGKGAAGQAVQALNVALGLDEPLGLL